MLDYSRILSKTAQNLPSSGIRKFFDIAAEYDDVISLSVGEPDFKTPWAVRKEGIASLQRGHTWYTSNSGLMELREEIHRFLFSKYALNYNPATELLVTVGGSESIDICIRALIEPGDEALIVEPCYVAYAPMVTLAGGVAVTVPTKSDNGFKLTAAQLKEKITDKTKLLVFPYPNNPTGGVMRRPELEEIAAVLRGTDIIVLSDEIYSELTYGEPHVSIASLEGMRERTVVINGFSKAFAMTGWRLGYAGGPEEIISQMTKIHQYAVMCSPTTSQYAAVYALRDCEQEVRAMAEEYNTRRQYVVREFNEMGLRCFEPEGAFYVFPDITSTGLSSTEFCEKLLRDKRVAIVPGTAFGASGEGFIRVSYCYSFKHIVEAVKRIKKFLEELV